MQFRHKICVPLVSSVLCCSTVHPVAGFGLLDGLIASDRWQGFDFHLMTA